MASTRVMYWKEIPVQVLAEEGDDRFSVQLDARFQEAVDAIAMMDGSAGTDDYLSGWEWQDRGDVPGSAEQAARQVAERFDEGCPRDLVGRIRDLHQAGRRDPRPGAIDHWFGGEAG